MRAGSNPRQSDFYALKLGADEIAYLREFNMLLAASNIDSPLRDLKNGDLALLVAMHASTRENDNWTWQTFWWQPCRGTATRHVRPTSWSIPRRTRTGSR